LTAINASEAETVYVTHGFIEEVVRYLNETGVNAVPLKTQFVGDDAADMEDEESKGE
jgi:putative mRNA 3-end processing factor